MLIANILTPSKGRSLAITYFSSCMLNCTRKGHIKGHTSAKERDLVLKLHEKCNAYCEVAYRFSNVFMFKFHNQNIVFLGDPVIYSLRSHINYLHNFFHKMVIWGYFFCQFLLMTQKY